MRHTHDRVENLLAVLALAVADQMAGAMTDAAAQGGGAPAALVQIADHPGLTIEDLRRRIGLSHSTVVRLLDRLAGRGLVQRDRNQQDARTAGLRLTEQGQALARSVLAARKQVTAAIITRLTPDRQRDL
jgi:MarR family transcriptional regulator, negative regulator of the multidrug operon emrRAB